MANLIVVMTTNVLPTLQDLRMMNASGSAPLSVNLSAFMSQIASVPKVYSMVVIDVSGTLALSSCLRSSVGTCIFNCSWNFVRWCWISFRFII